MIERSNHNEIMFVCDECGEEEQLGTTRFDEAWEQIKALGWIAKPEGVGEFTHLCGDCK